MTIHYKLLPRTPRGILLTKETPLLDIDSGFLLQVDLPEPGEYVAVLTAQDGKEHMLRIGAAPIPIPAHLVKPQLIAVTVLQIKDAKPFKRWICPAIRFASLAAQGKLMLQAVEDTAGLRDEVNALYELLDELKGEIKELKALFNTVAGNTDLSVNTLNQAYNGFVEAHNALEERVTLIEAQYDPARM